MSLAVPHQLPRIVERGVAQTLDLDVRAADGTQQTASVGALTIRLGSRSLLTVTPSLGPPASYALLADATENEPLSNDWLEVWTLTISGQVYAFKRSGYLVRHAFHPTIGDSDLTDRDSDLLSLLSPTDTTLQKYREQARQRMERDLLRKGRRPWLIFDSYDLCDAHIALSLAMAYRDLHMKVSDGRYEAEYKARLEEYEKALASASFRYDDAESGVIDNPTPAASQGPLILSAAPSGGRRYRWGGWR
jgi:hypothetical protein